METGWQGTQYKLGDGLEDVGEFTCIEKTHVDNPWHKFNKKSLLFAVPYVISYSNKLTRNKSPNPFLLE